MKSKRENASKRKKERKKERKKKRKIFLVNYGSQQQQKVLKT